MLYWSIRGAHQLAILAQQLKDTGDKSLRRELTTAFTRATKKPKADARARALSILPKRGGLAALVAGSRMSTRTRPGGRGPVLKIVAANADNIRRIDKGQVSHPVFGHPDRWVQQPVKAGWWSDPMKSNAPEVKREVAAALAAMQAKFESRRSGQ